MSSSTDSSDSRIAIIIDTDTNNELDDQHALAYAFFNAPVFHVLGVTINHTAAAPNTVASVQADYDEAERVMTLCQAIDKIPLKQGAQSNYEDIKSHVHDADFEGQEAIDFIIEQAHTERDQKLILLGIGKLTNLALAFDRDPSIVPLVKVVWLGGNYSERDGADGEHNLRHDPPSYNAVIESGVEFEMVTVRYNDPSGTSAVAVSVQEIKEKMHGKGPVSEAVAGRYGGEFSTFGDYSIELFVKYTTGTRPLFDMAALAIIKNPEWAEVKEIPAPKLHGAEWSGTFPGKTIKLWENFDKEAILGDFFETMTHPRLVK